MVYIKSNKIFFFEIISNSLTLFQEIYSTNDININKI